MSCASLFALRGSAEASPITTVAFSVAAAVLVSGDAEGGIHVWSLSTRRVVQTFPRYKISNTAPTASVNAVNQIRILKESANGIEFAAFYKSGDVAVYGADGVTESLSTRSVSFSRPPTIIRNGAVITAMTADNQTDIFIIELLPVIQYANVISVIIPAIQPTAPILIRPQNTYVASREGTHTTMIQAPQTGDGTSAIESQSVGAVLANRFVVVSDDIALVSATESGHIVIVTFTSAKSPSYYRGHTKMSSMPLLALDVTDGGHRGIVGVCAGADTLVHVFRIVDHRDRDRDRDDLISVIVIHSIRLPNAGVNTVAIRSDGAVIAVSGWDNRIHLIRQSDGEPLSVITHTAQSNESAFASSSTRSLCGDTTAVTTAVSVSLGASRSVHSLSLAPSLSHRSVPVPAARPVQLSDLFASACADHSVRVFAVITS